MPENTNLMPQGYDLRDPRPTQRESPYTFFLPSAEEVAEIAPGQQIKLIFVADPASEQNGAERMWVTVTRREGDDFTGELDNEPADIPTLKAGDIVQFKAHHIIGVLWETPEQKKQFEKDLDGWFARCYVDAEILEGTARVQFLYREPPEHSAEDNYPDTGWRLRADVAQLTDEQYENPRANYVAIGAALNRDDSFLSLLDAPQGSAFFRESGADDFHPVDPPTQE